MNIIIEKFIEEGVYKSDDWVHIFVVRLKGNVVVGVLVVTLLKTPMTLSEEKVKSNNIYII